MIYFGVSVAVMFAPFLYVLHAVAVKKSFDGGVSNDFLLLPTIAFIFEAYSLLCQSQN